LSVEILKREQTSLLAYRIEKSIAFSLLKIFFEDSVVMVEKPKEGCPPDPSPRANHLLLFGILQKNYCA
jgi:hypothetical protein